MKPSKFIKKSIPVSAIVFNKSNITEITKLVGTKSIVYSYNSNELGIKNENGIMYCVEGDYVIKGLMGEFYPCRKDIFEETYDMCDEKSKVSNMLRKYIKKSISVLAMQYKESEVKDMVSWLGCENCYIIGTKLYIKTLEGDIRCNEGDYVIRGVKGEFYPCNESEFLKLYTPI